MIKKGSLTGLLLFGMFFGAGNLIFPPQLGLESGQNFWLAIGGFVLSGVGIAILTLIIGTLNPKGYIDEISKKIAPWFAVVYLVALYLAIGPFFAIPRTATTAFSVGIEPMLPAGSHAIWLFGFTLVYFALAYLIALNPSKVLDTIGRYLTPIFALLIVVLVVLGAAKYGSTAPQGATAEYAASAFGAGFLQGYNTLDALASVAFSVVAVTTLNQLGFKNKKEYISTIWVVGILVALGFSVLYIGLAFLGNHFPLNLANLPKGANVGASVLSSATQAIFGPSAGYLWAYLLFALVTSSLTSEDSKFYTIFLANLIGDTLVFVGGVIGLHFLANMEFSKAIAVGVTPFILPDLLKIVAITLIGIPIFKSLAFHPYFSDK